MMVGRQRRQVCKTRLGSSGDSLVGMVMISMMLMVAPAVNVAVAFQPTRHGVSRISPTILGASLQTPASESSSSETTSSEVEAENSHNIPSLTKGIPLSHHATSTHDHHHHHQTTSMITTENDAINITPSSLTPPSTIQSQPSHVLSIDEMNPILKFNKNGKDKVLNATGLYHLMIILVTMPFWLLAMEAFHYLGDNIENFDSNRSKFDYSGKVWCRTYLSLTNCYPEIDGDVARLKTGPNGDGKSDTGACLFVANHASFLDIAVLCCVLDPTFKFIAKDSLKKFPGVGRQLVGGEHVLIDRTDKRSQLRTFKQAISYLKNGVPIMAFPEGARSPDGRLMSFKPGIFSMAVKSKVPIVPLSLANTHAVMPSSGFLPVQSGGGGKLRVFVHDPISVEGKSEEEISREVREALLSELPLDQHPLENEK